MFALVEVHRAVRDAKTAKDRAMARLRQADLERRANAPEAALEVLKTLPSDLALGPVTVASVRCAALTESGRVEQAAQAIDEVPVAFGAWALEKARLQLRSSNAGGVRAARGWANQAVELATGHPLAVELRFEAHVTAAWLALADGQTADAGEQLDAAMACLTMAKQPLTLGWLRALRPHLAHYSPLRDAMFRRATDPLVAKYVDPVEHHRDRLGGVPIEVHGVRMQHGDDPDRFTKGILMMAMVMQHRGELKRATEIARVGAAVAQRLFDGPVDDRLAELVSALTEHAVTQ